MTTETMRYFSYSHLPFRLQEVSKPIADLAAQMEATLPQCGQKSIGMIKLLEAKDCFVRAAMEKQGMIPDSSIPNRRASDA